jgi:hypothetical protein
LSLSLPSLADHDSFRIWRSDTSRWLPAALDIARSYGLASTAPHVFATGTNLVIALDVFAFTMGKEDAFVCNVASTPRLTLHQIS